MFLSGFRAHATQNQQVADDHVKASEHELVSILVLFGLSAAFD